MARTRSPARRRTGPGSRSRRGFVANTKAPPGSYAIPAGSAVGGKGRAKYPINTRRRAANALARVNQKGSPAEKKKVYAAVRREYPAMAKRSSIPAVRGTRRRPATRRRKRR